MEVLFLKELTKGVGIYSMQEFVGVVISYRV